MLKAGKSSIKSVLTPASKERQMAKLEESISKIKNDITMLDFIMHVIIVRLYEHELPRFKRKKGETYRTVRKEFGNCSISQFNNLIHVVCKALK